MADSSAWDSREPESASDLNSPQSPQVGPHAKTQIAKFSISPQKNGDMKFSIFAME